MKKIVFFFVSIVFSLTVGCSHKNSEDKTQTGMTDNDFQLNVLAATANQVAMLGADRPLDEERLNELDSASNMIEEFLRKGGSKNAYYLIKEGILMAKHDFDSARIVWDQYKNDDKDLGIVGSRSIIWDDIYGSRIDFAKAYFNNDKKACDSIRNRIIKACENHLETDSKAIANIKRGPFYILDGQQFPDCEIYTVYRIYGLDCPGELKFKNLLDDISSDYNDADLKETSAGMYKQWIDTISAVKDPFYTRVVLTLSPLND